jgi:hypothetical protein
VAFTEIGVADIRVADFLERPCRDATQRNCQRSVEHPFGTMKARMGAAHFLTKKLSKIGEQD